MKPFNLEEYLKNPSRKVITRDGRPVRIICTDRESGRNQPVVALYRASQKYLGEMVITFCANGLFEIGRKSNLDLFFAPEKHEGWTLFIKCDESLGLETLDSKIYYTKEDAQRLRETHPDRYGAIVKLEWEE